jgi:ketosteroid isomerase-like protein
MSEPSTPLADTVDRAAIIEVTHRYCWALDARDWALLDQVFTEDATAELLSPLLVGRNAIRARIRRALDPLDATQHTVTNHMVTVRGDAASSRCYLHSQHVLHSVDGSPHYVVAGRYEDELVRGTDGWRITFRRLVQVWAEGNVDVVRRPGR